MSNADSKWSKLIRREIRLIKQIDLSSFSSIRDSLVMISLLRKVRNHTMVSVPRLKALYKLSNEINRYAVRGDIVECGVYNGGSAAVMAHVAQRSRIRRDIWLFDSFEGLPRPTQRDGAKAEGYEGKCMGDPMKVKKLFQELAIPESDVHIIKGWFHETFPSTQIQQIALLHIDADWYESVKLCLEHFYDKIQPGGFVVLDDYGYWEGCRAALDEFLAQRDLKVRLVRVDYTGRYFQKKV